MFHAAVFDGLDAGTRQSSIKWGVMVVSGSAKKTSESYVWSGLSMLLTLRSREVTGGHRPEENCFSLTCQ